LHKKTRTRCTADWPFCYWSLFCGPSWYRKPPTISPGLIYIRKRFLMGLYKGGGGGLYTGGLNMDDLLC
jgi:hypothetical protein